MIMISIWIKIKNDITLILQVLPPDVINFGTLFLLVTSNMTLGSSLKVDQNFFYIDVLSTWFHAN